MKRRSLVLFAIGVVGQPAAILAQQATRSARIGFLASSTAARSTSRLAAFQRGLSDLGHVVGQNIVIESRFAGGEFEKLPRLAAELIRLGIAILVTEGTPAALAAKQATASLPVVFGNSGDPVGAGLVASLARPGGNLTGLSDFGPALVTKRLELLKEVAPSATLVAVLLNPGNPSNLFEMKHLREAAGVLKVSLMAIEIAGSDDFEAAEAAIRTARPGALVVAGDPTLGSNQQRILGLAEKYRLPAIFGVKPYAVAGGLISFGPNFDEMFHRAATFVHKILSGSRPADLPVEQPTKFEMVVNLKTAKALGLTIPPSILALADEVIE